MSDGFHSKYKVLHKIGEGSFSEVLKCEDRSTGLHYAAKRLKKTFTTREEILNCAEIVAIKKIEKHPNVVQMLEYYYEHLPGKVTFIFELMDMSMYDYMKLKKRCVPENRVKNYLYQMLKGLDHLHKNGLFHRDIKPENVLIKILNPVNPADSKTEIVKLADLGSIRGIYSNPPYTEYISTRWYRSPECLLTMGYYGPKMDIWASGCVFYEMLTLKPLFPGTNEIDQLAKIHTVLGTPSAKLLSKLKRKSSNCEHFPKMSGSGLHSIIPRISGEGFNVLKSMIQYDPDNRINVKRLLEHKYFYDFRHSELLLKINASISMRHPGTYKKISGDYHTPPSSFYASKLTGDKEKTVGGAYHSSGDPKKHHHHIKNNPDAIPSSRTTLELSRNITNLQAKPHFIRQSTDPLVGQKQMKSWGVDPSMLYKQSSATRGLPKVVPPPAPHLNHEPINKYKSNPQKRVMRNIANKNYFRKTTSDLPQMKTLYTYESLANKQFQSKSFVLPWRMAGKSKLWTIEEAMSTKIPKTDHTEVTPSSLRK